ncbi:hypothetical protein ACF064_01520 [Streptomyces sp. NPDC015492]|uniref:hypothetical protein n=1 Tax=Streptomyces sp. NPDC015492 TaxID=3364958 RepID=UPI0036F4EE19
MTTIRRTPQTIARSVRDLLYASTPGAVYNTYPNGPGTRPVPVENTAAERAVAASLLADALIEWGEADPQGYAAWEAAFQDDADANPEQYARR